MFGNPQRGRAGFLVPPEPVVQDRFGPLEYRDPDSFAAPRHFDATAIDERGGLGLAPRRARSPTLA